MQITPKVVVPTTDLTTSLVTLFTCPSKQKAQTKKCTLFNYTATAVTVDLYVITSGGTASGMFKKADALAVPPNQALDVSAMRQLLQEGDFIQGLCSSATSCSIKIDADIIT